MSIITTTSSALYHHLYVKPAVDNTIHIKNNKSPDKPAKNLKLHIYCCNILVPNS